MPSSNAPRLGLLGRALLLSVATIGFGCNSLTGADDLSVDDNYGIPYPGGPKKPSSPSGDTTTGGTSGGDGSSGDTSGSSTGGDPLPPAETLSGAEGVNIDKVALYQGVERTLMQGGSSTSSSIPIVAGRNALVRVFVGTSSAYDGAPVTARLFLDSQEEPFEVTTTPSGNSTDGSLGSTVNFDLPGSAVTNGFAYRVELLQLPKSEGADNAAARYPSEGLDAVGASSSGQTLKIVLVPISYGGDGSNRMPDTSSSQVEGYANAIYAMYPVPNVDVTVHAAVQWNSTVAANGTGWDSLLTAIADFRESDNAPSDTYYYGIFAPASSFGSYCSGGCVAGLGFVGGASDSYTRAAIGLGFSGGDAADTAVHEIGHNHGRSHAPCGGASGTDPSFPYGDGGIGVWGYDLIQKKLFSPSSTVDMMSYCSPIWLSDYTYKGLFSRIASVNNAKITYPASTLNQTYERARVTETGDLEWMDPITLRTPPIGEEKSVEIVRKGSTETTTAHFYGYDHLEGGVILWPESASPAQSIQLAIAGKMRGLSR